MFYEHTTHNNESEFSGGMGPCEAQSKNSKLDLMTPLAS